MKIPGLNGSGKMGKSEGEGNAIYFADEPEAIRKKAIEQIKEKNYQLRFQGKIGEIPVYEGSILAVGISYDKKTKKHSCEVEKL